MPTETLSDRPRVSAEAIDKSLQAAASSAHSRINIPLNLENWRDLAPDLVPDLMWFHQHLLDNDMSAKAAAEAVGYDVTNVYRVLKGIFDGSYEKFCAAVRSYRKIAEDRGKIQNAEFVHTKNTRLIFDALDYTIASNTICLITGETGSSKTLAVSAWRNENNHGRTVLCAATEVCPVRGSIAALAEQVTPAARDRTAA